MLLKVPAVVPPAVPIVSTWNLDPVAELSIKATFLPSRDRVGEVNIVPPIVLIAYANFTSGDVPAQNPVPNGFTYNFLNATRFGLVVFTVALSSPYTTKSASTGGTAAGLSVHVGVAATRNEYFAADMLGAIR